MRRVEQWEKRTGPVMTTLALVFLVAYARPIIQPGAPEGFRRGLMWVQDAVWVVFAADSVTRLVLAARR